MIPWWNCYLLNKIFNRIWRLKSFEISLGWKVSPWHGVMIRKKKDIQRIPLFYYGTVMTDLGYQRDLAPISRWSHYNDVIMGTIASQITNLTIVYSTVYSDADLRKYQSSASLAFVRGIHRRPVNSPHKWPVTRKMFPFDDVIMHYKKNDDQNLWLTSLKAYVYP